MQNEWVEMFIAALRQACDDGELPSGVDLNQLVFEITAMMFAANFAWIVTADEQVLDHARLGIRNILSRFRQGDAAERAGQETEEKLSPIAESGQEVLSC